MVKRAKKLYRSFMENSAVVFGLFASNIPMTMKIPFKVKKSKKKDILWYRSVSVFIYQKCNNTLLVLSVVCLQKFSCKQIYLNQNHVGTAKDQEIVNKSKSTNFF